jgi:magnesium transporter
MVTTRLYRAGRLEKTDFPVDDISEYLKLADATVWADFTSPTPEDLASIERELELHSLAVEDAVHDHQRPKLDRYDTHLFLVAYAVLPGTADEALRKSEVKAFITSQAVITVHPPGWSMKPVTDRWDANADLAVNGAAFLTWGLLDVIVDGHFDAVQALDARIDAHESTLFDEDNRGIEVQKQSFELRKNLVELRRAVLPMRDVLNSLMRRDDGPRNTAMTPYFLDVNDHVLRAIEWTESLRDLVATILDTNLSLQGNRMNLVMKKVTSWAAIIAVPTAITGFFGQNLRFLGYDTVAGTWVSLGLIAATSFVLYLSFKRRDWL